MFGKRVFEQKKRNVFEKKLVSNTTTLVLDSTGLKFRLVKFESKHHPMSRGDGEVKNNVI